MPHNRGEEEVTRVYARHCTSSRAQDVWIYWASPLTVRGESPEHYMSREESRLDDGERERERERGGEGERERDDGMYIGEYRHALPPPRLI